MTSLKLPERAPFEWPFREEAHQHLSRAGRQSQRAAELEGVLAGVKGKVQHLEDSYISKAAQQHGLVHQLQQDKKDMQVT